jgi:hypothetical protein
MGPWSAEVSLFHLISSVLSSPGLLTGGGAAMPLHFLRHWEPFNWRLLDRGCRPLQGPEHTRRQIAVLSCHALWLARWGPQPMLRRGAGPVSQVGPGLEAMPNGAGCPGGFRTSGGSCLGSPKPGASTA